MMRGRASIQIGDFDLEIVIHRVIRIHRVLRICRIHRRASFLAAIWICGPVRRSYGSIEAWRRRRQFTPDREGSENAKRRARKFEKRKILTNKHPLKGGDGGG